MVTQFEEVMNLVDASMNILTMAQIQHEAEPILAGALWGVSNMLERALDIMEAIEAEKEAGLDAFPTVQDKEPEPWVNVTVPRKELVKEELQEMENRTVTFEELVNRQFDESEDKEAAEHHGRKTNQAAEPAENEGGPRLTSGKYIIFECRERRLQRSLQALE